MNRKLASLLALLVFALLALGGSVASAQSPDGASHERVQQRAPAACPPDIQWGCVLSGSTTPGLSLNSTATANNSYSLYASLNNPGNASAAVWGRVLGSTSTKGYGVYGSHQGSGYGVYGYSNNGIGFLGYSSTGTGMQGETYSTGTRPGVLGQHRATTGMGAGVEGRTNSTSEGAAGVRGVVNSEGAASYSAGVRGVNNGTGASGSGVWGSHAGSGWGVYGTNNLGNEGGLGTNWDGVYGKGSIGVYGEGKSAGYEISTAGYFEGDVKMVGDLTVDGGHPAPTGTTRVDHPLDPENQYLQHAAIESSEVLNLYSGNAVLNANGQATVEVPDWFTAVNSDFRYVLTPIGGFAPLYIASEIENNRFQIAGGTPGMKVSWQVTATRNDAYMQDNPFQVEVPKPEEERGTYLYPAGYGQPESRGVNYEDQQRMRQMQDAAPAPGEVPGQ